MAPRSSESERLRRDGTTPAALTHGADSILSSLLSRRSDGGARTRGVSSTGLWFCRIVSLERALIETLVLLSTLKRKIQRARIINIGERTTASSTDTDQHQQAQANMAIVVATSMAKGCSSTPVLVCCSSAACKQARPRCAASSCCACGQSTAWPLAETVSGVGGTNAVGRSIGASSSHPLTEASAAAPKKAISLPPFSGVRGLRGGRYLRKGGGRQT